MVAQPLSRPQPNAQTRLESGSSVCGVFYAFEDLFWHPDMIQYLGVLQMLSVLAISPEDQPQLRYMDVLMHVYACGYVCERLIRQSTAKKQVMFQMKFHSFARDLFLELNIKS